MQVIRWFSNITDKNSTSFIQLDIDSYYSSVTEAVLTKALDFAKSITQIDADAIIIIFKA